ncbi:MAG: succinylglutamate desuccinylase/aspartoacylase family protein [Hyphomicrobiales bacterium]
MLTQPRDAFPIGDELVRPGERRTVHLPVSMLSNHTPMNLAVHVIHGDRPGPVLFVSAAVHGDELTGVEIIRRLLVSGNLSQVAGTLLAVPIVNALGFLGQTRYMPDGRDLNRSFPGSDRGSLASILADLFLREVVLRSHFGIDLHSAGGHRTNLPQVRIAPEQPELLDLAEAFGAPVILVSKLREGSLRQHARLNGVKVLLYEGGEALRIDEVSVRAGVLGVLRVMKSIGMLQAPAIRFSRVTPAISYSSTWLRAPEGGILVTRPLRGERVRRDDVIAEISDPFGERRTPVVASEDGIVIGHTNLPVVNRGDALFHIARVKDVAQSQARVGRIGSELEAGQLFDEDEIV